MLDADPELARKFFAGGIPPDVDSDEFRWYFEQFGTVIEAKVVKDQLTQRHRGFGFVTMGSDEAKQQVFSREHTLRGRKIELRHMNEIPATNSDKRRKIFVGGISPLLAEADIEAYFSRYSEVEKVEIRKDTNDRPRGFGFVTFKDEKACAKVLEQRSHMITLTERVDIRPVEDRERLNQMTQMYSAVPHMAIRGQSFLAGAQQGATSGPCGIPIQRPTDNATAKILALYGYSLPPVRSPYAPKGIYRPSPSGHLYSSGGENQQDQQSLSQREYKSHVVNTTTRNSTPRTEPY